MAATAYIVPGKPVSRTGTSYETDREQKLRTHCLKRISVAEMDRNKHIGAIEDCYRYTMPWRHRANTPDHVYTDSDLYDSTAMAVVQDFVADMMNTLTPAKSGWVELEAASKLDAGDKNIIAEQLANFQEIIFDEMRRSNLYAALQEAYADLSVGTMALLVQDRHPSEPIHCTAIAATDLYLERDPWGGIGAVWRKMSIRENEIKVLWPDAKPPYEQSEKDSDEGEEEYRWSDKICEVWDGLFRDWSDRGTERWHYVVMTTGRILWDKQYSGEGSCMFIVARWARDSTTAWGIGPTRFALPDIKTQNHLNYVVLKNTDKVVDPPFTYENDGVMNFANGLEPGMGYAREVGSQAPEPMESKNKFDVAFINSERLVHSIKRAHYQDRPEQTGKTPPTATQWADEAAERARRTAVTNLVQELQYPLIKRFSYLLGQRGILPKVKLQGEELQLQPVSPLLRAQEQEKVVRIDRFLELANARFGPQMVNAWVKQDDSLALMAKGLGVPMELIRNKVEMQAMIANVAQLAGGQMGGGQMEGGAAAAPPVPV
jgi:hypothetical protein